MTSDVALTRAEAADRARLLDVLSYSVDLDFTRGDEAFGSRTTIRFRAAEREASTFIDLHAHSLRRIELNGRSLEAAVHNDRIELANLEAENELLVDADIAYSRTAEGMHRFVDPEDGGVFVYAVCGPDLAARVFACFDQPDLKAPFTISVIAPDDWTVLSHGKGRRVAAGGRWEFEPTEPISTYLMTVAGGPFRSILTEHDGIALGLHCRPSLAAQMENDSAEILDVTRRAFDRYHELFDDRYAFGKYDQVFVPEMNWGAVEKPGCVLFNERYIFRSAVTDTEREHRAVVIAHEMAHMWFGNLVTMRWWDDVWLSESFAEYMGYEVAAVASRFTSPWTAFAVKRKAWGYDADQRPSTHPVSADNLDNVASAFMNFDGISYAKGASALRQLVTWVGQETFLSGVNAYFAAHRFANADLGDLLDAIAGAAGRDVRGWSERWLRTSGVDTLRAARTADGSLMVTPDDLQMARPHRLLVGAYDHLDGRLVRRGQLEVEVPSDAVAIALADLSPDSQPSQASGPRPTYRSDLEPDPASGLGSGSATDRGPASGPGSVPAPGSGIDRGSGSGSAPGRGSASGRGSAPGPGSASGLASAHGTGSGFGLGPGPGLRSGSGPDLLVLNDADLTYAKVRLDEDSWQAVTTGLSTIEDPLTRALLWNTARDMVRDGDLPVADYLRLVEAHLPAENVVTIVEAVLAFTHDHIADRYVGPAERPATLAILTCTASSIIERTGDAPDLRLAAVRALISSAQNTDELARLQDWLAQGRIPDGGPDLDPELRWQVLLQLCVHGHVGEREIEAALIRDPSATGKKGAARCRAALPDEAAKQRAWDHLFTPNALSNHLLTATAEGFWQPAWPETTAPYIARYFEEVASAGERGAIVARTLGEVLFPVHAATAETLSAVTACLARDDLTASLRRALADQLDDLHRAVRIRAIHSS